MKIKMTRNNMMVLAGWAALMSQPDLPLNDLDYYITNQDLAKDQLDWMTYSNLEAAVTCCFIIQEMVNDKNKPSIEAFEDLAFTADKYQVFDPTSNPNPKIKTNKELLNNFLKDLETVKDLRSAQNLWDNWSNKKLTSFGSKKAIYFMIQYQLMKNKQWSFDPNHQTIVNFKDQVLMATDPQFQALKWF